MSEEGEMRAMFLHFLRHDDGLLPADAVADFIKFCFTMDADAVLDDTTSSLRPRGGRARSDQDMCFVMQGCDKILKKIIDGLEVCMRVVKKLF